MSAARCAQCGYFARQVIHDPSWTGHHPFVPPVAQFGYVTQPVAAQDDPTRPTPETPAVGTSHYPHLKCDECGAVSFDLTRMGEICACPRRGAFRLHTVAPVPEDREEATARKHLDHCPAHPLNAMCICEATE